MNSSGCGSVPQVRGGHLISVDDRFPEFLGIGGEKSAAHAGGTCRRFRDQLSAARV
jgi:hypothetical protein